LQRGGLGGVVFGRKWQKTGATVRASYQSGSAGHITTTIRARLWQKALILYFRRFKHVSGKWSPLSVMMWQSFDGGTTRPLGLR
jgi:hypothetical protein